MKIQEIMDSTWLFELGFPMRRFDVLDSPSGLFDDLTWSLKPKYHLPELNRLSSEEESMQLKGAWHEKGIFLELEFMQPDALPPPPGSGRVRVRNPFLFFSNTRYAPGLLRGNAYCSCLAFPYSRPDEKNPTTTCYGERWVLPRMRDSVAGAFNGKASVAQFELIEKNRVRMRAFIGAEALPVYSPIEFPEISIYTTMQTSENRLMLMSHSRRMPTSENPSLWCRVRLID